uniref:LisH domain-containing protein n=1 Tax=Globodera rostochiensis TaxID=31243 RepID=A0A914HGI5_GLORO
MLPNGNRIEGVRQHRMHAVNQEESAIKAHLQEEVRQILLTWEDQNENSDWDVEPSLKRMAEILEEAINDYLQNNPDPMDERHPFKSQPTRPLGYLLKMITKEEDFLNKYLLARDNTRLNTIAARLLLDLLPDPSMLSRLQDADSLLTQLFRWAENSDSRELRAYSMALLGSAMDAEQAHQYRQQNATLIPIALQRLQSLFMQMLSEYDRQEEQCRMESRVTGPTDFAHLRREERETLSDLPPTDNDEDDRRQSSSNALPPIGAEVEPKMSSRKRHSERQSGLSPPSKRSFSNQIADSPTNNSLRGVTAAEGCNSNSSWRQILQPILVGTHSLYPLSVEMEQRLILNYLGPTSEYQDNLSIVLENHALDVVLSYLEIDGLNHKCRDIRLLFDAIRYISSLLIHRKFAWEFIAAQGIQRLLRINRKSIASTAVTTCLYYLAYSADIMEKVCHLPEQVLNDIIDYALYELDHNHESGRASIAMFLAHALQFRPILDRFDQRDGLRRLYNYISTLTVLQRIEEDGSELLNDEHIAQSIVTIKNAVFAFRTYLSSHVFLKMEQIKRSHGGRHHQLQLGNFRLPTIPSAIPGGSHPYSKPMSLDDETERCCVDYLIKSQCMLQPHHHNWRPIEEMRNLGVFKLLFNLITNYPNWNSWERSTNKFESLKLLLELFRLATVSPKVQLDSCETMKIRSSPIQGIGLILELAEGLLINDIQVQRLALEVLINCLCGQTNQGNVCLGLHYRFTSNFERDLLPRELLVKLPVVTLPVVDGPQTSSTSSHPNAQQNLRLFVTPAQILKIIWKCSQQNNAIMVLTTLLHKQQPATEADSIREIACRALNGIARFEPIRQILSKLPIIANNELITLIQSPVLLEKRMEHSRFCEQARQLIECVSQTKLQDFAMEMTQENLWRAAVVAETHIKFNEKELLQLIYQHLSDIGFKRTAKQLQTEADLPNVPASRIPSTPASLPGFPRQNEAAFANVLARRAVKVDASFAHPLPTTPRPQSASSRQIASGSKLPLKLHSSTHNTLSTASSNSSAVGCSSQQTPATISSSAFSLKFRPHKSLSEIVINYFRNEHSTCRNPVANCPPFSLFYPHRCPEPKMLYPAQTNIVNRLLSRPSPSYRCTMDTLRRADRRLVFSRFRHWKTFSEESEALTCCTFSPTDNYVFLGTYAGDIFVFNIHSGTIEANYNAQHSAIKSIQPSRDQLMLTSSAYVKPYCVLWKMDEKGISIHERLIDFNEEESVEFANLSTSQIVATQGPRATIYDTETAAPVVQLAYFDPMDELVLNDGILFDPRIGARGRVVHKFDKLNPENSGIFHPRGTEVIINCEVWDLRTHRLLHTVPALNQLHQSADEIDDRFQQMFGNYFRSFDSTDYQVITTIDTKKPLLDFCSGHTDNLVGLIEIGRSDDDTNFFKLYEIGRRRDFDEDEEDQDEQNPEEEEEEDFSLGSSSSSSSSSSSNNSEAESHYVHSSDELRHAGGLDEDDVLFVAASGESNDQHHEEEEEEGLEQDGENISFLEENIEGDDDNEEDGDYEESTSDSEFELSSSDFSP